MKTKLKNTFLLLVLTTLLGAVVGLVLWLFLQAVRLGSGLIWETLPGVMPGGRWVLIPLCALGGLLTGLMHKKFGEYPESLDVVLGRLKTEKRYDYRPMPVILVCALLPLIFGASVGPEAGLAGIIAALCCWIGDNVTFAGAHTALYSEIGQAVTLGQLFHMPLFGILAVEESNDEKKAVIPGALKLVLYAFSCAAAVLTVSGLNHLTGHVLEGFPSFSYSEITGPDYLAALIYIPVGLLLCLLYEGTESLLGLVVKRIPTLFREGICGLIIGVLGLIFPVVLFSGEEQLAALMDSYQSYAPLLLIGVCLLKILMTAFCLRFGMKGGHFFPLIFACSAMGFALAMLLFSNPSGHVVFAAAVVTSATLGAQLKKPLAVSVLMLLCFPVRSLFWIFLAAAVGAEGARLLHRGKKQLRQRRG